MKDDKLYITAQGRLPRELTRSQRKVLSDYAALFGRLERQYIADIAAERKVDKKDWVSKHKISARQFTAIQKSAKGKIDSQLSNLDGYLIKQVNKIRNHESSKKRLEASIAAYKKAPDGEAKRKNLEDLYKKLRGVDRGLGKALASKAALEQQIQSQRPSICLGGRKLFREQFNLTAHKHDSHLEWRRKWQSVRRSQFFVLGSKDERMGCYGCIMTLQDNGKLTLKIRLPRLLEEEYEARDLKEKEKKKEEAIGNNEETEGSTEEKVGNNKYKYLTITDIEIGYGYQNVRLANLLNLKRRGRLGDLTDAAEVLNGIDDYDGLAVNYRFHMDENKGWRVLISMEQPCLPKVTTDVANGVIGVDLNYDHLAVCEIDHEGNHVKSWSVPLPTNVAFSSRQNKTAIEKECKKIVHYAKEVGKPLAIEKLNFAVKKAKLHKKQNGQYNSMLSTLKYRVFEQVITRQGLVSGVEVKQVNPAWTSFIGNLKYLNQTRERSHEAAALVIARRGRGYRDRLPKVSRRTFRCGAVRTFVPPEDGRKGQYAYAKTKGLFDKWLRAQTHALRLSLFERLRQMHSVSDGDEASLIPY